MHGETLIYGGSSVPSEYFVIIIGIQPLGQFGQRPELSQATGTALVRCILGKFLGVVCHCFPPPLDIRTLATRSLNVRHNARDPSGGRWHCGRKCCPVILPKWRLPRPLGILLHAANLRHGTDGFTSPPRDAENFFLIGQLRPVLNPPTWVLKARTLPLDHRIFYDETNQHDCRMHWRWRWRQYAKSKHL